MAVGKGHGRFVSCLMSILVLNCGSATVKHKVFADSGASLVPVQEGIVELEGATADYGVALASVFEKAPASGIRAVAHRVVHGGDLFTGPTLVEDTHLETLKALGALAPLHNPPALEGIRRSRRIYSCPHFAFFDTAFHQTIPPCARTYAIPQRYPFRRYGFHGLSHQFLMERFQELTGRKDPTLITLHLGNGASACAIKEGKSVDTSMGYTPLEGLVMGTRSGDVDPAIAASLGVEVLNKESGLLALAGTSDMREILRLNEESAIEIFCYRIRKYVGAYLAVLEGAEAVVFSGGIGENSPELRRRICAGLVWAGCRLDEKKNEAREGPISTDDSTFQAWVLKTDEEFLMARETAKILGGGR